jgi:hypothetical protein
MNSKEALRAAMDLSQFVLNSYLSDLSDADLMTRPGPGCNHLAWQLGHLISSESNLVSAVCPEKGAELPEGFAAAHSKESCGSDDPKQFCSKQEYLDLYAKVRESTVAALESLSDGDFDKPSPEWIRKDFPKLGQYWALVGTHPMMHAGQFAVVRRKLGKPILM